MKTLIVKIEPVERKWWVVDLAGVKPGRVATHVADVLRGKNKPIFSPHLDTGDNVIAVNASEMNVGRKKLAQKRYYRFSGYPGGLSSVTMGTMMTNKPEQVFRLAVQRMLPKNRLGRKVFKKLHVYPGPDHPHAAQKPEKLEVKWQDK
jgi:large subunit ribosomal protein L13